MSNVKSFLNLYNWVGIEYPTTINENNYTLLEKHNPKIALIVLHVDVDIKIFQNLGQVCAYVYK